MVNNAIELERIAKTLVFTGWFAMQRFGVDKRRKPQVGDMVFEYTTIHSPPYLDKVGILILDSESIGELKTLDGRIVSWSNHIFGFLPESM